MCLGLRLICIVTPPDGHSEISWLFSLQVGSSLTEQNSSFVAAHNVSIDDGGLERAGRPVFVNVR